ncbi:DHH phosphoesterase [Aspergillus steynii IBT 23096]|uniref:DHH phosphoesterase n=1 Tax=Aspergillus steynii IBT 23096 TaxID=1392250 RepID=A0A2I2GGA1_9EURO|nr:DHH phosphoesterase [Aspergillus steynii IBT 23096]PLB51903.1 DHH phosphoesterase [Aspergillus steynii IBT 23096]
MAQSLLQMLRAARQTHLRFVSGALSPAESPIYVIGNSSADLDSMVCALVYSYFANRTSRRHIPLINLSKVPSGPELRRLRPEFAKALWISTNMADQPWDDTPESAGPLLRDHILTVADFAEHLKQQQQHGPDGSPRHLTADAVLVDWNALPIRPTNGQRGTGRLEGLPTVEFSVVGCIDHHVDEGFLAPNLNPLVIEKAGSCSSLVTTTLHTMGLWPTPSSPTADSNPSEEECQIARLAMAPLLIDTVNMTAADKVTAVDTRAQDILRQTLETTNTERSDIERDYAQIQETKQNSLDLLTVDEILDRDYKQWAESSPLRPDRPVRIGFCSMVKPIPWIVRKAGSARAFLDALRVFAEQRNLDIVVVMTAFSSSVRDGAFVRELLVCAPDDGVAAHALRDLEARSRSQLQLQEWSDLGSAHADGQSEAQTIRDVLSSDQVPWRRIWVQGDVTKSRKQVAPLVRETVTSPAGDRL